MRGISVEKFGGPEECKFKSTIPIPEPDDDQVKSIQIYDIIFNIYDIFE